MADAGYPESTYKESIVSVQVRAIRLGPDGMRAEAVLEVVSDVYVLTVQRGDTDPITRVLRGPDLPAALADAPEVVSIDAATRLEISCADPDVHSVVVAALDDSNPSAAFAEEAWPADTQGLPDTGEWPIDEMLRHRWIIIDGGSYHLLPVERTRAVCVENGEICSGDELASASWSFDGEITSSTGSETLRVIGGDTLVRQNLGDDFPETTIAPFDGDLTAAVVNWLDDNAYAAVFLVQSLQAPGLTTAEQSALVSTVSQSVAVHVEQDAVVAQLCARGDRGRFRKALAAPDSPDGKRLYNLLREIISGDETIRTLLAELV